VPENGVKNVIKERKYNQGYLTIIKYKNTTNIDKVKVKMNLI